MYVESMPKIAFLDITSACNLKCSFCYNAESGMAKHPDVNKLKEIQSILAENGCREITYIGGEPTLYPLLPDLLNNGTKLNILQTVISNGQQLNLELIYLFSTIPGFKLGVSFHDHRKEVYENVTCVNGSFDKVINTMDSIDNEGMYWYTQTSVIRDNYLQLIPLHEFLKRYKSLKYMDFSRMIFDGRGKHAGNFLNMDEWEEVFLALESMCKDGRKCVIEAFPLCWLKKVCYNRGMNFDSLMEVVRPCRIFLSQIVLDFNGNVRSCPTGGIHVANMFVKDLKEIWNNNKVVSDYRKFKWLEPYCSNDSWVCELFEKCAGGCRRSRINVDYSHDVYTVPNPGIAGSKRSLLFPVSIRQTTQAR